MRLPRKTELFLALLCSLGAGCVGRYTTDAERSASFASVAAFRVGETPLREYLLLRAGALLLTGKASPGVSSDREHASFRGPIAGLGMAVPVDSRGYFLTAAHCLGEGPLHLIYLDKSGTRAEDVRIVWRGDTDPHPLDLALVCVSGPIEHVFTWAPAFKTGDNVIGAGPNYSGLRDAGSISVVFDCFAGRILKVSAVEESAIASVQVSHSAPVRHGDSGGPLVNQQGELVAIDAQGSLLNGRPAQIPFYPHGTAYRPELGWLQRLIDEDFGRRIF